MKRLKGPELKMPELKTPDFLTDLYYDLRDRRLLPFVALALVAIAAVPFLLGGKSEEETVPDSDGALSALGAEKTSQLTVVEATPGLRDYRKRLGHRSSTDPFVQRYTGLPASAQIGGGGSGGEASAVTVTETTATTEATQVGEGGSRGSSDGGSGGSNGGGSGSSGGGSQSGGSGGGAPPQPQGSGGLRIIEYVYDLQISHTEIGADGSRKMSEPEVRHHVKTLAQLPSPKVPVATIGGVNFHTGEIYFLVADEVQSLDGDFRCVTRAPGELCELLEIQPGFPLELTYGPNKILYRIKVTGIDAVWAGKPGDKRSTRASFVGQNFSK